MDGRVVVVTGETGLLGRAVVARFRAANDVVCGISRSGSYAADLGDREQAAQVIDRIAHEHGRIDVLAHTVGGFAGGSPVHETPHDTWDQMLQMNFWSSVRVVNSVLAYMIPAGRGRIVAVSSRASVQPAAGLGAYVASKAALNGFMETVAREVSGSGITANVVLPSNIGEGVSPQALAETIFWLASEQAGDVNGALVPVYGRG